ncbi:hypothetical protein CS009_04955 [Streptococcus macedonicus]|uniref:DUF4145 domain-containing protein n=1 Tax=Streptococcus macedonicus TaxID=59310 RepID=A0AAP8KCH1_STRMC|nr:DUF4145 domain-containing protein [Streptococcus macedonicus]PHV57686.1 hypothetical protein CS009_04955 [Streptococcus macedonicus]
MYVEVQPTEYFKQSVEVKDTCKICNNITSPIVIHNTTKKTDNNHYHLALMRFCSQCKHYFIDEFNVETMSVFGRESIENITLQDVKPELPSDIPISDNLAAISPIGKEIYLQSLKAEQEKLDHIAGIGFRKALEFFVKDFVIATNPKDKSKVEKMLLKQVIDKYIKDDTLQTFATASTFIGNDETHYVRKHSDKDLQDLRRYLHGFLHFIEMQLNFLDAQELVNRPKKS